MMDRSEISSWMANGRRQLFEDISRVDNDIELSRRKLVDQSTKADIDVSRLADYSRVSVEFEGLKKARNVISHQEEKAKSKMYQAMRIIDKNNQDERKKIEAAEQLKTDALSLEAKRLKFKKDLQATEQKMTLIDRGFHPYKPNSVLDSLDFEQNRFAK